MKRDLSTSTEGQTRVLPIHWIEHLFAQMSCEYGKKFSDQWGNADPQALKEHWAARLGDLTDEELRRGVAALQTKDWPPSLPEFHKMCRPPIDETVAYYEAVQGMQARERGEMGTWSHPAIFWAAAQISAFDLKSQSYSQLKQRWEKTFAEEMAKGQWAPVPQAVKTLPAPGKSQTSKDEAAKMLTQYQAGELVKGKNANHRAWIGNVLKRHKDGDHTLPSISVKMAKEALKVSAV